MGAIYQYPSGHMLIDSFDLLPNTPQQSTPTQCWCVPHFSAISNNNEIEITYAYGFFFFLIMSSSFLTKLFNYTIHLNFVFKHFRNSQTYYPPKASVMESFIISIN